MPDFPYTGVHGKLKKLLDKIREVGRPQKVNREWLKKNGFTSSSDRTLIPVLKTIRFIDDSGVPTDLWNSYKGAHHRQVIAQGIRSGYSTLFDNHPAAYSKPNTDLTHFFSADSPHLGKQAIGLTVATFKMLCEMADFTGEIGSSVEADLEGAESTPEAATGGVPFVTRPGSGTTVNINVQLTIPETANAEVYESLFAAMKKHLWPKES